MGVFCLLVELHLEGSARSQKSKLVHKLCQAKPLETKILNISLYRIWNYS